MFDFFRYLTFFLICKMVKKSSAKYYQKTKKGQKKACKSYQNLSEDEKEDKQQYSCKQC